MQTPDLNREEEWIARYRAALDAAPPPEPSYLQLLGAFRDRLGEQVRVVLRRAVLHGNRLTNQSDPKRNKTVDAVAQFPTGTQTKMSVQGEQFVRANPKHRKAS